MLTYMIIRNFAIIHELEVEFHSGFTVITGETGAGKSILINALNLLLGGRGSSDIVRADTPKALLEGSFALTPDRRILVDAVLNKAGIQTGEELIIRRTISRKTGRSRAFVNGSVVGLGTLRALTRGLIDISGQHEHYSLLNPEGHIDVLDHFGGLRDEADLLVSKIERLRGLRREVRHLRKTERKRLARIDYLRFQIDEIENGLLGPEEGERLDEEASLLRNAEMLRETSYQINYQLHEGESSITDALSDVSQSLQRLLQIDPRLEDISQLLEQAHIQLGEAGHELRNYRKQIKTDPENLEQLEERLYQNSELMRKYGDEYDDVISQLETMQTELEKIEGAEGRIDEANKEYEVLSLEVMTLARILSSKRREAGGSLKRLIEQELSVLGMPFCLFGVEQTVKDKNGELTEALDETGVESLNSRGLDEVEFMIRPNPGEGFKPMAKVASGGELSRIMLAIKGGLMATDPVSTYIFDEIDSGIGGGIAVAVGDRIRAVARNKQVISITHLPQIAACADQHFKVAKIQMESCTTSSLTLLTQEQRVQEIARMLGGIPATQKTIEHAKEMLQYSID